MPDRPLTVHLLFAGVVALQIGRVTPFVLAQLCMKPPTTSLRFLVLKCEESTQERSRVRVIAPRIAMQCQRCAHASPRQVLGFDTRNQSCSTSCSA